jgi:hypothetical protein
MAGAELAMSSKEPGPEKVNRFLVLATAALAVLNVGLAVIVGVLGYHALRRGRLDL